MNKKLLIVAALVFAAAGFAVSTVKAQDADNSATNSDNTAMNSDNAAMNADMGNAAQ